MASTDVESAADTKAQVQQQEKPRESSEKDEVAAAAAGTSTSEITQMEIQSAPVTFVGLGKEDLMVLANKPFWVRLRWALFITFWLMWLGLLVGAALIIALSPGCDNVEDTEVKTMSATKHHR